jgi:hypothetical protein
MDEVTKAMQEAIVTTDEVKMLMDELGKIDRTWDGVERRSNYWTTGSDLA